MPINQFNKWLVAALLALHPALHAQEETVAALSLNYLGDYLKVSAAEKSGKILFSRKLVAGQSFQLPHLDAKGKFHKQLMFTVGERNLVLKLQCSAKQQRKQLGAEVFSISFGPSLAKKPPCFTSDDGPRANLPPST